MTTKIPGVDNPVQNPQPKLEGGATNIGVSDFEADNNPYTLNAIDDKAKKFDIQVLAYGNKFNIGEIAYGGNTPAQSLSVQSSRIGRLQRGVPRMRRGILVPAVPRTKSQTIYTRDPGQAVQNKVLSINSKGVTASGTPAPGTSNQPNLVTGAVNRYRTDYPTLIQPSKEITVNIT